MGTRIELLITNVSLPDAMNGRQVASGPFLPARLEGALHHRLREEWAARNGHLKPGIKLLTKPFTLEALSVKVAGIEDLHLRMGSD